MWITLNKLLRNSGQAINIRLKQQYAYVIGDINFHFLMVIGFFFDGRNSLHELFILIQEFF